MSDTAIMSEEQFSLISAQNKFMSKVYGWMTFALILSGLTAYGIFRYAQINLEGFIKIFNSAFYICAIGEIVLVIILSALIRKMNTFVAGLCFILYSVLNGATLSSIFFVYQINSIISIFFVTAMTFGVMAVFGAKTKKNILSWGKYLSMALIGLVIATAVQFLLSFFLKQSFSFFDLALNIAGVIIFTLLTAYDAKKIMVVGEHDDGSETYRKAAIIGALSLYLDFINLFIRLLRLFGKKK